MTVISVELLVECIFLALTVGFLWRH